MRGHPGGGGFIGSFLWTWGTSWLGEHDEVVVEIAEPDLAVAGVRVHVHVGDDRPLRCATARDGGIELRHLEPERDAVADGLRRIGELAVVMAFRAGV